MKKFIIYILSIFYIFSASQLIEFAKIPKLVNHYIEHSNSNSNLSIGGFLVMHYSNNVPDDDYEKDIELPFKSNFLVSSFTSIVFFLPFQNLNFENKIFIEELVKPNFKYTTFLSINFQNSIWQPPKCI